jgi:hypothetical protein
MSSQETFDPSDPWKARFCPKCDARVRNEMCVGCGMKIDPVPNVVFTHGKELARLKPCDRANYWAENNNKTVIRDGYELWINQEGMLAYKKT